MVRQELSTYVDSGEQPQQLDCVRNQANMEGGMYVPLDGLPDDGPIQDGHHMREAEAGIDDNCALW